MTETKQYCCEGMMKAMSYDFPFSETIQAMDGQLRHLGKDITLAKRTPSGNISRAVGSRMRMLINFCPWCGADVRKVEDA